MINLTWVLAAALAAAGAIPPAADFPCDKIGDEILEVYDGLDETAARTIGPVEVRKKAVLFERRLDLAAQTFTFAGDGSAGGPPIVFRKYRRGAKILLCTQTRNDAWFGAGDTNTQFMLRCLSDGDGDGAYEGFTREVKLVPLRKGPGAIPGPGEEQSPVVALPRPVALVSRAGLNLPNAAFKPSVLTRISIARVSGSTIELRFTGGVRRGPSHLAERFMGGTETIVSLPMTDGAEVPVQGTRIRFAKSGGKWTAAVLDGFGAAPRLQCGGAVVEAGDTFAILTPGGHATFARAALQPRQ